MKRIGMVVAVEIDAVLKNYGTCIETIDEVGFVGYRYQMDGCELIIIHSGAGQIAAASATQLLISKYGVEAVVNFGIVGGLTEEMAVTKTCVVESVVHYDFDTSESGEYEVGEYMAYPSIYIPATKEWVERAVEVEPTLRKVICASGDKFIGAEEKKRALHTQFKADICEMEAAGIILTCNRNKVPCLLIKTVSDGITGGAAEFIERFEESATICVNVMHKVLEGIK